MKRFDLRCCRIFIVGSLLVFCCSSVIGQTFGEFFNQKKTQKRYLLEQIAALQVYIGYAKKGYDLVGSGLQTLRDLSNGEFSLHSAFISSLSAVSPYIRDHVKVPQIIAYQMEIIRDFERLFGNPSLTPSNLLYLSSVKGAVLSDCLRDMEELLLVVRPALVEMDNQERLLRLDRLYLSMQDKAAFCRDFSAEINGLIRSRTKEQESINFLMAEYGIVE